VTVPDGPLARIVGHFKILRELQGIGGAGIFTEATEHATRSVVGEGGEDFAAGGIVTFPANDDEIFRARQSAEIAANAKSFSGFGVIVQARRAAIALRDHGAFEGVLLGVDIFRVLGAKGDAHAFEHVQLENPFDEFFHADSLFAAGADVKDSWVERDDAKGDDARRVILCQTLMSDLEFMQMALEEARACTAAGEVPIGAVLVRGQEVLARGGNRTIRDCDPTAHAEIVVLRQAARQIGNYRLLDATLYVTLEPCAMCAGAIVQARVPRVVYGADDPKGGAFRTCFELLTSPKLNHQVEVTPGVLGEEATSLLQSFFEARR